MAKQTQSVETWIQALGDFHRRREARQALMDLPSCPVKILMQVVGDTSLPLNQRWAAITVLAEAKAEQAVPLLVEIMRLENNLIDEASAALKTITGLDCGLMADDWARELGLPVEGATSAGDLPGQAADESPVDEMVAEIAESLQMDQKRLLSMVREAVDAAAASVVWDEGGYVHADIRLGEREQQVLVAPGELMGFPADQLVIYTECGIVQGMSIEKIKGAVGEPPAGKLQAEELENGIRLTVSCALSAVGLDMVDLRASVLAVARYADGIEHKLTGSDQV